MRALENISASLEIRGRSIAPAGCDQQCVSLRRPAGVERLFYIHPAYFFLVSLRDSGNSRCPQNELFNRQLVEPGGLAKIRKHRGQGQARSGIAADDDSLFLMV